MGGETMNLSYVSALLVDPDLPTVRVVSRILRGFGLQDQKIVESGAEAKSALESKLYDIVISEATLPDMSSADFIRWLRRLEANPVRLIPIVVLTGYSQQTLVELARDAGANLVVKKPVPTRAFYDRLNWLTKGGRLFVEGPAYSGPDRRFKNAGLPGGVGRRATDVSGDLGDPTAPNMSQDEIDALIKPMKVSL
jgi:CheY-like chemotaxis protein